LAFGKNREGYFLNSPKDEDEGGDLHLRVEMVVRDLLLFFFFSFSSFLCVVLVFFTLERERGRIRVSE
jgi:hypothetical protein